MATAYYSFENSSDVKAIVGNLKEYTAQVDNDGRGTIQLGDDLSVIYLNNHLCLNFPSSAEEAHERFKEKSGIDLQSLTGVFSR